MEILKAVIFVAFGLFFAPLLFNRRWFEKEIKRNDVTEPPTEQQLRWDIRHMREDMHAIVIINLVLLVVVVAALLFKI